MAGQLASFLNGSMLSIKVGGVTLAYCQSLSFNQNVNLIPVGGIGSFSNHALEPVQFSAGGSMRVVRWMKTALDKMGTDLITREAAVPDNINSSSVYDNYANGNGVVDKFHFNPIRLLLSATFDIDVYGRCGTTDTIITETLTPIYKLMDCRLTNYSFSFQPGALLFEDMSFVCMQVQDNLTGVPAI
jgi:hypothetical protein